MKSLLIPIIACLALTLYLQAHLVQKRFEFNLDIPECPWCNSEENDAVRYLPASTIATQFFAPADRDFLADLFWLRACYYFGAHVLTDGTYDYLYYLLDRLTDLAPRWEKPYVFGAVVLYLEAANPFDATRLINKGIKNLPTCWELMFFKGYILWKYYDNLEAASIALFKASQIEGAPRYLSPLSASLATSTGKKEFTDAFLKTVMNALDDPLQKAMMQNKILSMETDE
jgi:hypothetical protein